MPRGINPLSAADSAADAVPAGKAAVWSFAGDWHTRGRRTAKQHRGEAVSTAKTPERRGDRRVRQWEWEHFPALATEHRPQAEHWAIVVAVRMRRRLRRYNIRVPGGVGPMARIMPTCRTVGDPLRDAPRSARPTASKTRPTALLPQRRQSTGLYIKLPRRVLARAWVVLVEPTGGRQGGRIPRPSDIPSAYAAASGFAAGWESTGLDGRDRRPVAHVRSAV